MELNKNKTIETPQIEAVILDLDGVITRTAAVHANAWKEMFDEYAEARRQRGDRTFTFDIKTDYARYIDGKPRYDGVRTFLKSREIDLPEGDPEDAPGEETICGLGNRKNELFRNLIDREGAEVYEDTVRRIREWRERGLGIAVVSSSKNCAAILKATGLTPLFDVRVDGVVSAQLGLSGKPDPDIFLHAAQELEVSPARAVVIEDALAGVEAGRAGHFGLVVGVDRQDQEKELLEHGAHLVVKTLEELQSLAEPGTTPPETDNPSNRSLDR